MNNLSRAELFTILSTPNNQISDTDKIRWTAQSVLLKEEAGLAPDMNHGLILFRKGDRGQLPLLTLVNKTIPHGYVVDNNNGRESYPPAVFPGAGNEQLNLWVINIEEREDESLIISRKTLDNTGTVSQPTPLLELKTDGSIRIPGRLLGGQEREKLKIGTDLELKGSIGMFAGKLDNNNPEKEHELPISNEDFPHKIRVDVFSRSNNNNKGKSEMFEVDVKRLNTVYKKPKKGYFARSKYLELRHEGGKLFIRKAIIDGGNRVYYRIQEIIGPSWFEGLDQE
jgi:hypothetical protein